MWFCWVNSGCRVLVLFSGRAGWPERHRSIWGRGLEVGVDDRLHGHRPVLSGIQGGAVRLSFADYPYWNLV